MFLYIQDVIDVSSRFLSLLDQKPTEPGDPLFLETLCKENNLTLFVFIPNQIHFDGLDCTKLLGCQEEVDVTGFRGMFTFLTGCLITQEMNQTSTRLVWHGFTYLQESSREVIRGGESLCL